MSILSIGDRVLFKLWDDRDTRAIGRIVEFKPKGVVLIEFNGEIYERLERDVKNSLGEWKRGGRMGLSR